jgi:hypothetical protein
MVTGTAARAPHARRSWRHPALPCLAGAGIRERPAGPRPQAATIRTRGRASTIPAAGYAAAGWPLRQDYAPIQEADQ